MNREPFDALALGGGLACVFGGGGFGIAAKARDEMAFEEPCEEPRRRRR